MTKLTWSNRSLETNCSEKMQKSSLMLKKEFTASIADLILRKIIGEKENIPEDWQKPELFNMSFVYNPQNYMYAKVSKKSR